MSLRENASREPCAEKAAGFQDDVDALGVERLRAQASQAVELRNTGTLLIMELADHAVRWRTGRAVRGTDLSR